MDGGCCEAIHLFEAVTSPGTELRKKAGEGGRECALCYTEERSEKRPAGACYVIILGHSLFLEKLHLNREVWTSFYCP